MLVLLLAGGCASVPVAEPPARPFITLESEAGSPYWRATWHLAEPATELVFERRAAEFRRGVFEVLTPGFTLEKRGDREVLRTSGAPSRTITVRFPVYTRWLEKEYEFFRTFSDGSVSIYTGHLLARPVTDGDDCGECVIRAYRLVGPPGVPVVVDGRVHASPMAWFYDEGQGTYVYIGAIEPVETPEMILVVDPALPDWLEDETKRALPRLFSLYSERFGVVLPVRPTVLFNYVEGESSGHSSGGGVLPGMIQLTAEGRAWGERSDDAMRHLFHFLAHEAVHLWNGQVVNYPDSEDSWMHEGSADALAERTLLELGLIDEARFLEYQSAALNECRRGLAGFPLREAGEREAFDLYYSCGNALALATERLSGGDDLFGFWRRLIGRALESRTYGADDYFAVLESLGAGVADIGAMRAFVESGARPGDIVDLLSRAGVAVAEVDDPPQAYGQSVARAALFALMAEHCRGSYGFNMSPKGMKLAATLDCGTIPGGTTVTHIGGRDVLREGHRVGDLFHERCGTDRPIRLTILRESGEVDEVEIACATKSPARPPYVRIVEQ
ncbi:MAG: hypothetical protein NDJ92_09695 [Thermoanaerobaculia bacterium]|nr:hypothetical protein [Thermoanaerobaculia bacterium]